MYTITKTKSNRKWNKKKHKKIAREEKRTHSYHTIKTIAQQQFILKQKKINKNQTKNHLKYLDLIYHF